MSLYLFTLIMGIVSFVKNLLSNSCPSQDLGFDLAFYHRADFIHEHFLTIEGSQ